jgi:hypothetical protein
VQQRAPGVQPVLGLRLLKRYNAAGGLRSDSCCQRVPLVGPQRVVLGGYRLRRWWCSWWCWWWCSWSCAVRRWLCCACQAPEPSQACHAGAGKGAGALDAGWPAACFNPPDPGRLAQGLPCLSPQGLPCRLALPAGADPRQARQEGAGEQGGRQAARSSHAPARSSKEGQARGRARHGASQGAAGQGAAHYAGWQCSSRWGRAGAALDWRWRRCWCWCW